MPPRGHANLPRPLDMPGAEPARNGLAAVCTVHAVAADAANLARMVETVGHGQCLRLGAAVRSLDELATDIRVRAGDTVLLDAGAFDAHAGIPHELNISFLVLLRGAGEGAHPGLEAIGALSHLEGLALLDREAGSEELNETIQLVRRGMFICDMPAIRPVAGRLTMLSRFSHQSPIDALSRREGEVLDLVAAGLSNKAIGWQLTVSEGTVKAHVSHIMAKLRLANRSQLVAYALATSTSSDSLAQPRPGRDQE